MTIRIIWISAMIFGSDLLSACDMLAHGPMAAQVAATAEGEMAHDELAAEPAK